MNKKTLFFRFFRMFSHIFFLAFSFYVCTYIVLAMGDKDICIRGFNWRPYRVVTNSMSPVLNSSDLLIMTNCPTDMVIGDIVVFEVDLDNDDSVERVVHYLAIIDSDDPFNIEYRTMRHFNSLETTHLDRWVLDDDDMIATHVMTISWLGHGVLFFQSFYGWAVLAVNGTLMYLYIRFLATPKLVRDHRFNEFSSHPFSKWRLI